MLYTEQDKKYHRKYYQKNKEKILKYQEKNKEKILKYQEKNKEKILKYQEEWRIDNPKYDKKYRQENKEIILKHKKQYRKDNLEKIKKYAKEYYNKHQWYIVNSEYRKKYSKKYYQEHKKERNEYSKNRKKIDLKYNLKCKILTAICQSLKGNKAGRTWESLTGYNLADLIKRLNETMPGGYTWQDFLSGELHIDHIIPIDAFNFTRPEHTDFKRCWALSNLRLLSAKENLSKHNNLDRPFQPALKI